MEGDFVVFYDNKSEKLHMDQASEVLSVSRADVDEVIRPAERPVTARIAGYS